MNIDVEVTQIAENKWRAIALVSSEQIWQDGSSYEDVVEKLQKSVSDEVRFNFLLLEGVV